MKTFRNRFLKLLQDSSKIIPVSESKAGDVCFYDKENNKLIIVSGKFSKSKFPQNKYTPIGIVAIPGSHKVYGENTCGIISLPEMNAATPTVGSVETSNLCFGPQQDVANLQNHNVVVVITETGLATNGFGYLSKNGEYVSTSLWIPDPYLEDGSRNPDYYNTSVSKYNAMSDFKGKEATKIIVSNRGTKDYSTWVPTYNKAADYPAASCCDMFYTEGTNQGDWYLPAAGEWGYIMSKWNIIQQGISLVNKVYDNVAKPLSDNASYWTSTDHNAKNARYVHTNNGMGHTTKTTAFNVRAFTIIKETI